MSVEQLVDDRFQWGEGHLEEGVSEQAAGAVGDKPVEAARGMKHATVRRRVDVEKPLEVVPLGTDVDDVGGAEARGVSSQSQIVRPEISFTRRRGGGKDWRRGNRRRRGSHGQEPGEGFQHLLVDVV